ncbi:PD40 domain-containing protein [Candidatus Aerophobetes bacterium]|nr:PD40 domain-containing protein [Candidatus Aerophobetes bacterium]
MGLSKVIRFSVGAAGLILLFALTSSAQFNHPELKWKVIETSHFLIHYHQGEQNFALQAASVAENIYQKLTSEIGYCPRKKIPLIIKNSDDETGGYTSVFTNKIVIQAQSDPLQSSGNLSWMQEVIGHELTHYISFSAIDESIIPIRKAMANLTLPMWFIEGLAQYLGEEWHPLKQMVVYEEAREKKIMSEGELGSFYFFDGWGRMSGYYQSDSLVRYIFETYGKGKIPRIFEDLRNQSLLRVVGMIDITGGGGALYPLPRFINFNQSLKKVIGKDSLQLYREWRKWLTKKSKGKEDELLKNPLIKWGRRAQCPVFSPGGEYLAFASNKDYDYAIFDLYLMNIDTKKIRKLAKGINPYFSFSPDGNSIIYSKTGFYPPKRSFISDLYQINLITGKTKRITFGERAFHPVFSPSGNEILFVKKEGGNSNLYLLSLSTGKITPLTMDKDGITQNFSPCFSPDGKTIAFVRSEKGKRNLYLLKIKEKDIFPLTQDSADERCPAFSPDGERIIFICDKSDEGKTNERSFNLWSLELKTGKMIKHTRVRGGIFDPAISADGKKIALSCYENQNFLIYIFPYGEIISHQFLIESEKKKGESTRKKKEVIAYIKRKARPVEKRIYPYHPRLNLNYIFPWFLISQEGSYFSLESYASDILEKHNLVCRAYFSSSTQYDIFYFNRSFEPTIWIDIYQTEGVSSFKGESFSTNSCGQAAGIYFPLNDKISIGLEYQQEKIKTHLFTSNLQLVPWEGNIKAVKGEIGYFNFNPVREPVLLPWGKELQIGAEWASKQIGSELGYLNISAYLKDYWRLSKNKVLALRLTGKKIETYSNKPCLVFSLKEWGELRGYPQEFLDSRAGENFLLGSLEYRFDLKRRWGGSSSFYFDTINVALFLDAGATWRKGEKLKESDVCKDVGAEFRLRMLPFGKYPLIMRFGVAWPLDYDRIGRFFIGFGGIF